MSGAQMAHFLKQVGNGSELEGIVTVYRTGWLVGAGQLVTVVIAAHGVFRLGKWGYEKLVDYLQERGYIVAAGEVVSPAHGKIQADAWYDIQGHHAGCTAGNS